MRSTFPLLVCCLLVACTDSGKPELPTGGKLRLATTTSTKDSGILAPLLTEFTKSTGIEVEVFATGTGKALQLARDGGVDVLLTHDRDGEEALVYEGVAMNRRDVMYNEFVLVGPEADPRGIRGEKDVVQALRRIAEGYGPWLSRGDDSGTHRREKVLWGLVGGAPTGDGFATSGAGMVATLKQASETRAYTLSDVATFLANREQLQLEILCSGDERLFNDYAVLAVNPGKVKDADYPRAMRFVDFLVSDAAHRLIEAFGRDKFGRSLFTAR